MPDDLPRKPKSKGEKVRVPFRRNRSTRRRDNDWTGRARDAEGQDVDSARNESVVPKGDISRQRTIIVGEETGELHRGVVVAMRGLYADVDDGTRVIPCTIRRIIRTRLIAERGSIAVGDRVGFVMEPPKVGKESEGVIELVEPRSGQLQRLAGRRVQTIAANIDQAIIVSSAAQPQPKPHLIDRYIISAHAGGMKPIICMNKIDLDPEAEEVLDIYRPLGYAAFATSALNGAGLEELRAALTDRSSVVVGQSGVGKSALLNALQPDLNLRVGALDRRFGKGRHTTTTAILMPLRGGGYIVDTPGVRSMDISVLGRFELEQYFVEFLEFIPSCKFPDCTHIHEADCAVIRGVEGGAIDPLRHESYVRMFTDPAYEPCYD